MLPGRRARHLLRGDGRRDRLLHDRRTVHVRGSSGSPVVWFHGAGGLPEAFFYALEETDLAWRLIDAGWRVNR